MYMQDDIRMATTLDANNAGGGLFGKLLGAGKRLLTGESFFITVFANEGRQRRDVAFAAPYPGKILAVSLADWGGTLLCDPGLVNNLPTRLARRGGAERVVAVDLSSGLPACRTDAVGMEVLLRAQEISTRLANRRCADAADVVITPDLDGRHWLDTSNLAAVIEAGETAARAALPEVRALLATPGTERQAS